MATVKRGFRAGRNEQATQENIELLTGQRGNGLDRAITLRDLASVGLAGVSKTSSGSYVISSGSGNSSSDVVIAFPTAPTGFQITGGFGSIMLRWDAPRYPGHAYTEVWRGTVETFADAALIATTPATVFGDIVNTGSSYYYWIRHVNANNRAGAYNATLGTLGKTSQDISDIIDDIGEQMRESSLIEELSSSVDDINANGSTAYQEMWSKKVSVGSITAGIGILADSEGNSQVAIAASQVFVFDPNVSDSLTPLLAVSDGVVTIPKAFIEEATIQVIQAQEITADHVSAGISIESPLITGGELKIGGGGEYADENGEYWHTRLTATGHLMSDNVTLSGHIDAQTGSFRGDLDCSGTISGGKFIGGVVTSSVIIASEIYGSSRYILANSDSNEATIEYYTDEPDVPVSGNYLVSYLSGTGTLGEWDGVTFTIPVANAFDRKSPMTKERSCYAKIPAAALDFYSESGFFWDTGSGTQINITMQTIDRATGAVLATTTNNGYRDADDGQSWAFTHQGLVWQCALTSTEVRGSSFRIYNREGIWGSLDPATHGYIRVSVYIPEHIYGPGVVMRAKCNINNEAPLAQ
ncbi:hypothetical protein CSW98_01585 [Vibrio sp. HA2012]|uniref:phage tail tip fiber protein n=1 Tax=Vibrio sp. HA2012 TaxID=1971595 RepID=UPI000C2C619B|nr:DUF1983 domain-containing protein [Vibrio sp. HA2012]PJC87842.1 hypothetical protein CSW98_01585 [Vibrio sp. HA2012]